MIKPKGLLILFILSMLIVSGCDDSGSDDESDNPNLGGAKIVLPGSSGKSYSYNSSGLSNSPLFSIIKLNTPDNIVRYEINFMCDALNYAKQSTAYPGDTITFTKLFEGRYTMQITAFDITNKPIFGGTNDSIDVVPRVITDVTVVLRDLVGDSFLVNSPPWGPKDLAYQIINDNQVDLTWEDNSVIEDGYRVYRMIVPTETSFTLIADVDPDTMFYSDTTYADNNGETWYRVCAYNEFGESNYKGFHFPGVTLTLFDRPGAVFDQCLFEP